VNARLEELAHEKELLLARSALCRLRLRRATHEVRGSLDWKRAVFTAAATPTARRIGFGLVLSLVGLRMGTRAVGLATRILVAAKLARSVIGYARRRNAAAECASEQTHPGIARSL
jgi:hypothetical protein